jgi:hypothetical protein
MRKLLITIISLFAVSAMLTAQDLQPNIFGVRAGLNMANASLSTSGVSLEPDSKISFNLGVSYQRLLAANTPLYFETGLYFTDKGFDCSIAGLGSLKSDFIYLQVPVLLNYHFSVADDIIIEPFAGLYAAYGIGGKTKASASGLGSESADSFDKDGYKNFDIGLKFGVGAAFNKIYVSVGYELGLWNIAPKDLGLKVKNQNWALLTVGYNF